ncbi:MAG: zinc-dependent peptidase [Actinobacteria bacterium]|nr:zinc-dependent peptidase [Actinomycetota bacterium]
MGWITRRLRGAHVPASMPADWRELVVDVLPHWDVLDDAERERLESLTLAVIAAFRWEAAAGIELDDEIRVVIAAHVALLGLHLPDEAVLSARGVLVHPEDLMLRGEYEFVDGIMNDADTWVSGLADDHGPIMISWDALVDDIEHVGDGRNLVFHEFAHHLDLLDGVADGTPPIDPALHDRWVDACTAAYELAGAGDGGDSLDSYAGVNPTEFFAVSTEAFFDAPDALRDEHPALYEVFVDYYGIDWSARLDALASQPETSGPGDTIQS